MRIDFNPPLFLIDRTSNRREKEEEGEFALALYAWQETDKVPL
jgi:hypothetical protein